ncbi:MAG: hypothetical protein V1918_02245 [Planctomycetota bacterium]
MKTMLPSVVERWGAGISYEFYDIDNIEDFKTLLLYEEHYGVEVKAPPVVFVGKQALVEPEDILKKLDTVIADEISRQTVTFAPLDVRSGAEAIPSEVIRRFERFGAGAVAVAGLVDGVNPCAFTTIVFLLSMLAYLGKNRKELVMVGAGFTAAVFGTYFLLGLGLLSAVKSFSVNHGLSSGLACGVALLAFALAGWSLWDYVRFRRTGEARDMTLGLPRAMKARIHKVIRTSLTTRHLLLGSLGLGVAVSLLESMCTGQVYLPTIMFVARAPGLRAEAVGYLLLYNGMFILPLVGILAAAYAGVRSDGLARLMRRRLGLVKLGMAALFAALGTMALLTV